MSLGRRRRERQQASWVAADAIGDGPRNAFYDRFNQVLDDCAASGWNVRSPTCATPAVPVALGFAVWKKFTNGI